MKDTEFPAGGMVVPENVNTNGRQGATGLLSQYVVRGSCCPAAYSHRTEFPCRRIIHKPGAPHPLRKAFKMHRQAGHPAGGDARLQVQPLARRRIITRQHQRSQTPAD